jgi:hypothetical protein
MSEYLDRPNNEYETYSWHVVWLKALTQPSVDTYERLIRDPNASANKAYGWVFICSTIAFVISYLIGLAFGNPFDTTSIGGLDSGPLFGFSIIWLACCAPLIGLLAVLGFALSAGLTQLIARILGGTGSYSELVYAYAAYYAPLLIITSLIYAIPIVNLCLSIPLGIYSLVLFVIAINAVNHLGWGKAIASVIIIPVLIAVFVACSVIVILALLGPQIGDVFSEIIRELSTPVAPGV